MCLLYFCYPVGGSSLIRLCFSLIWSLCKSCVFLDDEHILLPSTCLFCLLVGSMRFSCCQRLCGTGLCCLTHAWFPLVFEVICRIVWVCTGTEHLSTISYKGYGRQVSTFIWLFHFLISCCCCHIALLFTLFYGFGKF